MSLARPRGPALSAVHVSFYLDPQGRAPSRLLHDWPSLVDVAEAAANAGVRVTVVQACRDAGVVHHRGIDYHFMNPATASARLADSPQFLRLIRDLKPDLFHVHGLGFPDDVRRLATLIPEVPILIQDHADRPPRFWRRRRRSRRGLSLAAAVFFCARAQAAPFVRARLLHPDVRICQVPESSSHFTPGDRPEARRLCALSGDPALLWVGHLDRNKDPLTVLEGIRRVLPSLPRLQLWCCYGKSPLMAQVQRRLQRDTRLRACVHLLGEVPRSRVQELMRAADLFILGSHREGSGYALIEALASGLPCVVPDIPSFRVLTGNGATGRLWRCGDAGSLSRALLQIACADLAPLRTATRAFFETEISFDAVGRRLAAAYRESIELPPTAACARTAANEERSGASVKSTI